MTTTSNSQRQDVAAFSNEILPFWNLAAMGLMLVGSILTLLVFTADTGRYVPTGSVMGFQGGSYFYITGFWGIIITICWGCSIIAKLKRFSISSGEGCTLLIQEHTIGSNRVLTIPASNLKAIVYKHYPSAGHVAWLVIAIGWFAFIVQFALPNFQLPFAGFPTAGTALLIFSGCLIGSAIIGVTRPGLHLVILDTVAIHVIKLPGLISTASVAARISKVIQNATLMRLAGSPNIVSDGNVSILHRATLYGALGFLVLGIVNIGLLLACSALPVLNQGSSWAMIISGCIGLLVHKTRHHALQQNTQVVSSIISTWNRPHHDPRLWLLVMGIAGGVIAWYFFGLSIRFDMTSTSTYSVRSVALGVISALYTSWCIITSLDMSRSLLVELGAMHSAKISTFSVNIISLTNSRHQACKGKSRGGLIIMLLFGAIVVAFFLAGFYA
jgi:hypothetical protein